MTKKPRVSKQTNGIDTDAAESYVKRVENLNGDLDTLRGKYMADCKVVRGDIKEVLIEAKEEHGIPTKALKAIVKARQYDRKKAALSAGLDIDEGAAFEQMQDALEPIATSHLAGTPLAEAATAETPPEPLGEAVQ